ISLLDIQPVSNAAFGANKLSPMLAWQASCRCQCSPQQADYLLQLLRQSFLIVIGSAQTIEKDVLADDAGVMSGLVGQDNENMGFARRQANLSATKTDPMPTGVDEKLRPVDRHSLWCAQQI